MFPSLGLDAFKGHWKSAFAFVQRAISIETTAKNKSIFQQIARMWYEI
jgi:hypothetical protein